MTKFHLAPEVRPTRPFRNDGTDSRGRIGLDSPRRVTRDEATELMAHHLMLAHMYYQATPDDEAAVLDEVERLLASEIPGGSDDPELVGARAWLTAMNAYYAELKRQQQAQGLG